MTTESEGPKNDTDSFQFSLNYGGAEITIPTGQVSKVRRYITKYGMSYSEFLEMFFGQKGLCAMCHSRLQFGVRNGFCIDHDHETRQVRGILCHKCNVILGKIRVLKEKGKVAKIEFSNRYAEEISLGFRQDRSEQIIEYLNLALQITKSERKYVKFDSAELQDRQYQKYLDRLNVGWKEKRITLMKFDRIYTDFVFIPPELFKFLEEYEQWLYYLDLTDPKIESMMEQRMERYSSNAFLSRLIQDEIDHWTDDYRTSVLRKDFSNIKITLDLLKKKRRNVITDISAYRAIRIKMEEADLLSWNNIRRKKGRLTGT